MKKDSVEYQYMSEGEARRRAAEYGELMGHPCAVPLSAGDRGWVVAIQPGYRLCDACNGTSYVEDYECKECVFGWVKVKA